MTPALGENMLRHVFAGLPFQISHFDRLWEVPRCLRLTSTLPDGRLAAEMTAEGAIVVARTQVALLRAAMADQDASELARIFELHRARRRALALAIGESRRAVALDEARLLECIDRVGEAIAALAPYGLVTKVLPEVLRERAGERLRAMGAALTPEEQEAALEPPWTAATRLAGDLLALARSRAGVTGSTSAGGEAVAAFCARHVGFGPSAWEAPGFESPAFVLNYLDARFAQLEPQAIHEMGARWRQARTRHLSRREAANRLAELMGSHGPLGTLAGHLRHWCRYIDWQTGLLRRAYYVGILPPLRALSRRWMNAGRLRAIDDLCFFSRHELRRGPDSIDAQVLEQRREHYAANQQRPGYPHVADQRLRRLLEGDDAIGDRGPIDVRGVARAAVEDGDRFRALATGEEVAGGSPAAAPRVVIGVAHVVRAGEQHLPVAPGSVLVTQRITTDLAPLFFSVAGVLVEEGALVQHATLLAGDFGLPCVVGVRGATRLIRHGSRLELDGKTGRVRLLPS